VIKGITKGDKIVLGKGRDKRKKAKRKKEVRQARELLQKQGEYIKDSEPEDGDECKECLEVEQRKKISEEMLQEFLDAEWGEDTRK
jgi:hypothetical protein